MEGENINIIDNLIQAVSILNKTDEYLESLNTGLSECDSLNSDYEHLIENTSIDKINLHLLYTKMQENFRKRRKVKNDMALKENYRGSVGRLNNSTNREFLISGMKTVRSKLDTKYNNRILKQEDILLLMKQEEVKENKRGRGRPKKIIEEVK